jgi:hypothetical protein
MENMKIKKWYLKEYPDDEMGQDLLPEVTFIDLFEAMDAYQDVYVTLFGDEMGGDSLIRERIFQALADVMNVPYQEIYDQWLLAESKETENKETITEGAINFSYSDEGLPTYAFMDDIMDDDMEGQLYLEDTYNMAEDMILEANSEIFDLVSNMAGQLVDEYQYAYDLEGFVADGPIMIVPGYYDGFTLIIDFDDFNIEGMPEDLERNQKEMIKDFAIERMRFVANELGLVKVKSGGWTGPIVVEESKKEIEEVAHYMQAEKSTAPKVRRWLIKANYDQFEDFFGTGHFSYNLSELTEEQILYLKRKAKDVMKKIYEVEPGVEAFYKFLEREGY